MTRDLEADLDLALTLADLADAITLAPFETRSFEVGWKTDRSEVTDVDRAAERAIVDRILAARPNDGVVGEEHGVSGAASGWRWVIDPVDGTSGYTRGIPVWATLIALTNEQQHGGAPVVTVGVVSAPALGRRWWATSGGGTFAGGLTGSNAPARRCSVSDVAAIADAQVSVTFSEGWTRLGLTATLTKLAGDARRARGFGDFWQHALVAEGALDVAVDAVGVAPHDLAAVRLLVTEAGGRFTDRVGTDTHLSDTAVSSNGRLHDDVIARLSRSDL